MPDALTYRPGSGTEGMWFMDRWCDRCRRDDAFRRDEGDSCPIAAATMAFLADEPGYPAEWVQGPFGPCCTAFEPMDVDGLILDVRQMPLPLVEPPACAGAGSVLRRVGRWRDG